MADEQPESVLLDACVAINLLASGISLLEFCRVLKVRFVVAEPAAREALSLPAETGEGSERVDVDSFADSGVVDIIELQELELAQYLSFAVQVDDGEAATLAVAVHRGLRVATDDRKARRLACDQAPPIGLISTPELLRNCSNGELGDRLPDAIRLIERRASFRPRRDDPNLTWWMTVRDR